MSTNTNTIITDQYEPITTDGKPVLLVVRRVKPFTKNSESEMVAAEILDDDGIYSTFITNAASILIPKKRTRPLKFEDMNPGAWLRVDPSAVCTFIMRYDRDGVYYIGANGLICYERYSSLAKGQWQILFPGGDWQKCEVVE